MADELKKWPEAKPPVEGEYQSLSDGYRNYKKAEVSPGVWHWVIDEQMEEASRAAEKARSDLWWALRTRVLTDEEMRQVRGYGSALNTPSGVSYNEHEKQMELNAALQGQAELRLLAARSTYAALA